MRPRLLRTVLQIAALPIPLRMLPQEFLGVEFGAVGTPTQGPETERFDVGRGDDLAVHGPERCEWGQPAVEAGVDVGMCADGPGRGMNVAEVGVECVAQHALADLGVDAPVVVSEQLPPADLPRAIGGAHVAEPGPEALQITDPRILRLVVAPEVAIGRAPKALVQQALLVAGDLTGLDVTDQPGVGVSAVVVGVEGLDPMVDIAGVLRGLAGTDEFRDPRLVVAFEPVVATDRGLGDRQTGTGHPEIAHAGDPARRGLHDHPVTVVGRYVQDDVLELTLPEIGEAGVAQNDRPVDGRAAGRDKGAAVVALAA